MRAIKFRGRLTIGGEWIYGNLIIDKYRRKYIVPMGYFEPDGHHLSYCDYTDKPVFIDQDTIGQFTGLRDSKGVEIFENDVLRDEYGNVGLCHWYYAGWEFINTNGAIESGYRWEVIGTIHDAEYKEQAK